MATVYGYRAKKKRYGDVYYYYLNKVKEIHKLSKDELERYQDGELQKLFKYIVTNSEFYRSFIM